jgi:hypothetical protein
MSRAQEILQRVDEILPAAAALGIGASALMGGANIAHQALAARKRREEKIRQGGMGRAYDKARAGVKAAKRQAGRFSLSQRKRDTRKVNIQQAKQRVRNVASRGLSAYARRLGRASGQPGQQARRAEMTQLH